MRRRKSRRFYWRDAYHKTRPTRRTAKAGLSYEEAWKLFSVASAFVVIGLLFAGMTPRLGSAAWGVLVTAAAAWFWYEAAKSKWRPRLVGLALGVGLFLMAFDFVVETAGGFLGLWTTHLSLFSVGFVPGEIMLVTLLGGAAWALHVPRKPTNNFVWANSLLFAAGGAVGEYLLLQNGLMTYSGGWDSVFAFAGYLVTWLILFWVYEKVFARGVKTRE